MMTILEGKLTYIMAALAILWGGLGFYMGWADQMTAMNAVWTGLAVFGLRRAIG